MLFIHTNKVAEKRSKETGLEAMIAMHDGVIMHWSVLFNTVRFKGREGGHQARFT